jgi:hypothetical protein
MSTDDSTPTGSIGSEPAETPATAPDATPFSGGPTEEPEPGVFARHSAAIIAVMAAVIVAAVAIVGVWLYRNGVEDDNAATEAAFSKSVADQGASVDTVECDGGSCAAIIGGQAYSVLVQEDEHGKQHFGVSAYAGN